VYSKLIASRAIIYLFGSNREGVPEAAEYCIIGRSIICTLQQTLLDENKSNKSRWRGHVAYTCKGEMKHPQGILAQKLDGKKY
jgi:hypothetical protein